MKNAIKLMVGTLALFLVGILLGGCYVMHLGEHFEELKNAESIAQSNDVSHGIPDFILASIDDVKKVINEDSTDGEAWYLYAKISYLKYLQWNSSSYNNADPSDLVIAMQKGVEYSPAPFFPWSRRGELIVEADSLCNYLSNNDAINPSIGRLLSDLVPNNAGLYLGLGSWCMRAGDTSNAAMNWVHAANLRRSLTSVTPTCAAVIADYYINLGVRNMQAGDSMMSSLDFDSSSVYFDLVTDRNQRSLVYASLGNARAGFHDFDSAIEDYSEAVGLDSSEISDLQYLALELGPEEKKGIQRSMSPASMQLAGVLLRKLLLQQDVESANYDETEKALMAIFQLLNDQAGIKSLVVYKAKKEQERLQAQEVARQKEEARLQAEVAERQKEEVEQQREEAARQADDRRADAAALRIEGRLSAGLIQEIANNLMEPEDVMKTTFRLNSSFGTNFNPQLLNAYAYAGNNAAIKNYFAQQFKSIVPLSDMQIGILARCLNVSTDELGAFR